jgi:hypothetical protein
MTANVHPAPAQLADLAAVMRPDWDRSQLEGAVSAARTGGWSWQRVFSEVARLLVIEDSSPSDLTAAARKQVQAVKPANPALTREWAGVCRMVLEDAAAARGGAS